MSGRVKKGLVLALGFTLFGAAQAYRQELHGMAIRAAVSAVGGIILAFCIMTAMRFGREQQ